jgi:hypothetical protein
MAVTGHYQVKPSTWRAWQEGDVMVTTTAAALLTAAVGTAGAFLRAWLRSRVQCRQAREASRRDHVRCLPPGSRIVDLGERGVIVEVGGRAASAGRPD